MALDVQSVLSLLTVAIGDLSTQALCLGVLRLTFTQGLSLFNQVLPFAIAIVVIDIGISPTTNPLLIPLKPSNPNVQLLDLEPQSLDRLLPVN